MTHSVLITGVTGTGGIGAALVQAFADAGYRVIATGQNDQFEGVGASTYIKLDLQGFLDNPRTANQFAKEVRVAADGAPLSVLVNNAATQIVKPFDNVTASDLATSLAINVIAPFALSKEFKSDLGAARGTIINIGSVHAQASKPRFSAYATSKAALHGLTRSLAIDLGPEIRVNTLAPAATATSMLKDGFAGDEEGLQELKNYHPIGRIATPEEISKIAVLMASGGMAFMTGTTIYADGGILSRLHDPV